MILLFFVLILKAFSLSTMRLFRTSKDMEEYAKTSYRAELEGSSLGKVCFSFLVLLIQKFFKLDEFTVCLRVRHYQYPISIPRTSENTHTTIEGILGRLVNR